MDDKWFRSLIYEIDLTYQVTAEIKNASGTTVCKMSGDWNNDLQLSWTDGLTETLPLRADWLGKKVRPLHLQKKNESHQVWLPVRRALAQRDFLAASEKKKIVRAFSSSSFGEIWFPKSLLSRFFFFCRLKRCSARKSETGWKRNPFTSRRTTRRGSAKVARNDTCLSFFFNFWFTVNQTLSWWIVLAFLNTLMEYNVSIHN